MSAINLTVVYKPQWGKTSDEIDCRAFLISVMKNMDITSDFQLAAVGFEMKATS